MRLYNVEIDNSILNELYENEPLGYLDLKTRIDKNMSCLEPNKKIKKRSKAVLSLHTYSSHINKLLSNKLLIKEGHGAKGRGKKVLYSLSDQTRLKKRLGIFENKTYTAEKILDFKMEESKEKKRKMAYQLFFFFEAVRSPQHDLYTEEELEDLLSKIHASKSDLKTEFKGRKYNGSREGDYWHINTIITRFKPIDGVRICREDYLSYRISEKPTNGKDGFMYRYSFPGVSVADLLNSDFQPEVFRWTSLTNDEVQEACDLLEEMKIVTPINDFLGEKRYCINANDSLRDLLKIAWDTYDCLRAKMNRIWMYFRKPTNEELLWLKTIYGVNETNIKLRAFYNNRRSLKNNEQKGYLINMMQKGIEEFDMSIRKNVREIREKHAETIQKYEFPMEQWMEIAYPEFLRNEQ